MPYQHGSSSLPSGATYVLGSRNLSLDLHHGLGTEGSVYRTVFERDLLAETSAAVKPLGIRMVPCISTGHLSRKDAQVAVARQRIALACRAIRRPSAQAQSENAFALAFAKRRSSPQGRQFPGQALPAPLFSSPQDPNP